MKQSFTFAGRGESIPASSQAEHFVPLFCFQQEPVHFLISSTNMERFEGLYCALPPWKHQFLFKPFSTSCPGKAGMGLLATLMGSHPAVTQL